jgi:hypothetical protein
LAERCISPHRCLEKQLTALISTWSEEISHTAYVE